MGTVHPVIANPSHYGDATVDEMSLPKQRRRMIEALQDPDNWLGRASPMRSSSPPRRQRHRGRRFCIFLDYAARARRDSIACASSSRSAWWRRRTATSSLRDRYAPGVAIFGTATTSRFPTRAIRLARARGSSPRSTTWLGVAGDADRKGGVAEFRAMLAALAAEPANRFTLVETQGPLLRATGRTSCIRIRRGSGGWRRNSSSRCEWRFQTHLGIARRSRRDQAASPQRDLLHRLRRVCTSRRRKSCFT
jgi:hypothetical protein